MLGFRIASRLTAAPDEVWRGVRTLRGVNAELSPWLRMTGPPDEPLREGSLGLSWVLLGGVVPVDYDDLNIVEVDRRARIPRALHARVRQTVAPRPHDRTVARGWLQAHRRGVVGAARAGYRLGAEFLFAAIFRWRHRRLRERFTRSGA